MNLEGRNYYQRAYQDYTLQTSVRKLAFYLALLNRWVRPGGQIFEIGTGLGDFLELASSSYQCSGCEHNPYGWATSRQKVPQASLHQGSFESRPRDRLYQAVLAWDVLEHILHLDQTLDQIQAGLINNGFLIGVVPVYDGPLGFLVNYLDRDPTHVWKWSRTQWQDKIESSGFQLVESGGILRKLVWSRYYIHVTRPRLVLARVGNALYFVARKCAAPG